MKRLYQLPVSVKYS